MLLRVIRTRTVPCDGTLAVKAWEALGSGTCCHKSRTAALSSSAQPSFDHLTVMSWDLDPMLTSATIQSLPSIASLRPQMRHFSGSSHSQSARWPPGGVAVD